MGLRVSIIHALPACKTFRSGMRWGILPDRCPGSTARVRCSGGSSPRTFPAGLCRMGPHAYLADVHHVLWAHPFTISVVEPEANGLALTVRNKSSLGVSLRTAVLSFPGTLSPVRVAN